VIGGMVEKSIGSKRFLFLLIFAGLGTNLLSAIIDPLLSGDRLIVSSGPGPMSLCVFVVCALLAGEARTFLNLRFSTVAWILIVVQLLLTISDFYSVEFGIAPSLAGSLAAVPLGFLAAKILANRGV